MSDDLNLEAIESKAKVLLDSRIETVRELVRTRQEIADAKTALAAAERRDRTAYRAAIAGGWSESELRKLKLGDPNQRAKKRMAELREKPAETQQPTTTVENSETVETVHEHRQ